MATTTKSKKSTFDVYQTVTDAIIAKLKEGVVPWQKPWVANESAPMNLVSKKPYRGINVFLLGMQSYGSPYWLTFKQAAELGYRSWLRRNGLKDSLENKAVYVKLPVEDKGGVKKGEKSTLITFWKILPGVDKDTGKKKNIPLLRYFNVFNVEQCQNLDLPLAEEVEEREPIEADDACEAIVAGMPDAPPINHGGPRAFYVPAEDRIQMPDRDCFKTTEGYYSTLFHEMVHSTGHKDRLNRPELVKSNGFGTEEYSKEELTAEMGAAMLCAVAGIEPQYDNSAAYIKSWMRKLADDPKLVVQAAGKAQKAADFILDVKFDNTDDKTEAAA